MRLPFLVAVVEDDPGLRVDLVEFLGMRGYDAHGFEDAETFFTAWPGTRFDLLLLDVALPGLSGLDIAQRVRAREAAETGHAAGVLMLTALDANDDHVLGLNAGADIYLSKRSSLEVIEAACHSVLRRLRRPDAANADDPACWRLHVRQWRLQAPNGASLGLTHTEVTLLAALFESPGRAITREALLSCLGKQETLSSLRNLDNTASRLRRKVQAACGMELPVRPSYGRGYTFIGSGELSA